jgi:RimJ/RimL family protein N-acetyltransferase
MNTVVPELRFNVNHQVLALQSHDVTLRGNVVTLRPLAECDWSVLLKWNNDPDVMELADHNAFTECTLLDLQPVYRWISTHAHCFIIEVDGKPIGECWLQRMNLQRIVSAFPGQDVRRIDLMIGEKDLWGRGYGTETIKLLVDFGLYTEQVDAIFGIVAVGNQRSQRAFKRNGFRLHALVEDDDGTVITELVVTREDYESLASR